MQECFIVLVMRLGLPKSYVGCFQRLHAKRYVCILVNNWDWQAKPLTLFESLVCHCMSLALPLFAGCGFGGVVAG